MTPEQRSAYRDLLDHAWIGDPPCTLPDDDAVLASLSGLGDRWGESAPIIRRWFVVRRGRLVNTKQLTTLRELFRRQRAKQEAGKEGGRRSAESRAKRGKQRLSNASAESNLSSSSSSSEEENTLFARVWAKYPRRAGSNPRDAALEAWRARLHEGVSAEDLESAVERYSKFCQATGKIGTETVQQTASFFGPKKRGYAESWEIPSQPVAQRKATNGSSRTLKLVDGREVELTPHQQRRVKFYDNSDALPYYEMPDGTIGVKSGARWL